jgi:hypothetical protein
MLAVDMFLNVVADHVPTFSKQTFRPPAKSAAKIDREGHQSLPFNISGTRAARLASPRPPFERASPALLTLAPFRRSNSAAELPAVAPHDVHSVLQIVLGDPKAAVFEALARWLAFGLRERMRAHFGNSLTNRSSGIGAFLAICFMKKATPAAAHWLCSERAQSGCIGRAFGPLSPPTIVQPISLEPMPKIRDALFS